MSDENPNEKINDSTEDIEEELEEEELVEEGIEEEIIEEPEVEDEDDEGFDSYMQEVDLLSQDFSDLEDFDLEELQDIKDAIEQVKQQETTEEVFEEIHEETEVPEVIPSQESEIDSYLKEREQLTQDFSDLEELDLDELTEMKEAIASVSEEEIGVDGEARPQQVVSDELEEKIRTELEKRKEAYKEKEVTAEDFQNYIKEKRDKIWYHSLYYLVFETEDHSAPKEGLYDVLKEVCSKNPIDPIPQQQFYFGLGYILRLKLYDKDIVKYKGGKFKININVENLKKILEENGEPISRRPVISEEEQKKMISDFLKDDFLDI